MIGLDERVLPDSNLIRPMLTADFEGLSRGTEHE